MGLRPEPPIGGVRALGAAALLSRRRPRRGSGSHNSGRRLSPPRRRPGAQARSSPRSSSRAARVSRPGRLHAREWDGSAACRTVAAGSRVEENGRWLPRVLGLARARGQAWAGRSGPQDLLWASGSASGAGFRVRGSVRVAGRTWLVGDLGVGTGGLCEPKSFLFVCLFGFCF